MHKLVIFSVVGVLLCAVTAFSEDGETSAVTPFFGLSIPYPDTVPSLVASNEKGSPFRNRVLVAVLSVDEKGRVKEIENEPDGDNYILPIKKDIKKFRFYFTGGRGLVHPVKVPIRLSYSGLASREKTVKLDFPITPDLRSDSILMSLFFERNELKPPAVTELNPIFYKVEATKEDSDYLTITARVFLDERGELQNITFPIKGQDDMTHAVQMGLMNARFSPLTINDESVACDFLLTFRIFDNIKYPFSPLFSGNSVESNLISSRYFMTRYLSGADISIPPLPRNHGSGVIRAANLTSLRVGIAEVEIRIDVSGRVIGVSLSKASPGLGDVAREVIKLVDWYPAINQKGETEPFNGRVALNFDASTEVVYIPEWLTQ